MNLSGAPGLDVGVGQGEVAGYLPPGNLAEIGDSLAERLQGARIDAAQLGAAEADQAHMPAPPPEQLHGQVEAEQLAEVRPVPDAVVDEHEVVGAEAQLLARHHRGEVGAEAGGVDAGW